MIEIFRDTLSWMQSNPTLTEAVTASQNNTVLHTELLSSVSLTPLWKSTEITVTKNRTFAAAAQLHRAKPDLKIGVLNFASATNPGGGVQNGSFAQEESLCRCSTLYPCLKTSYLGHYYYLMHRMRKNFRYTDAVIYTPDVLIIKSDEEFPDRLPETQWFSVDVLTCAAPNLRIHSFNGNTADLISDRELYHIHTRRAKQILSVAVAHQIDIVVLGAFGCGAFRNNPEVVAQAYRDVLPSFAGQFQQVEFAVYCSERDDANYRVFHQILTKD